MCENVFTLYLYLPLYTQCLCGCPLDLSNDITSVSEGTHRLFLGRLVFVETFEKKKYFFFLLF